MQHSNPRLYDKLVAEHKARQARYASAAVGEAKPLIQKTLEAPRPRARKNTERAEQEVIELQDATGG